MIKDCIHFLYTLSQKVFNTGIIKNVLQKIKIIIKLFNIIFSALSEAELVDKYKKIW